MKYHILLKNRFTNWFQLEKEIERIEGSNKEKGDIFEDFVYAYLEINKAYYQISSWATIAIRPESIIIYSIVLLKVILEK